MMLKLGYVLILVILTVISVHGLPAKYCFFPFNRTDCGGPPTPVFSYYKPGSRCEIEIWRGCPSYNRFDSEITCSHFCIGKLRFEEDDKENEILDDDSCIGELNTADCGTKPTLMYTYNTKTKFCEGKIWRGCKTKNKFDIEIECMNTCIRKLNATEWEDKMENLSKKEVKEINDVLDKVLETTTEKKEESAELNEELNDPSDELVEAEGEIDEPVAEEEDQNLEETAEMRVEEDPNLDATSETRIEGDPNLEATTETPMEEDPNLETTTEMQVEEDPNLEATTEMQMEKVESAEPTTEAEVVAHDEIDETVSAKKKMRST